MDKPAVSVEGKVAVVTGARRGIGKAIALTLARAGADVAVCDLPITDGLLEATAGEIRQLGRRSVAIQTDITRKAEVEKLAKKVLDEFGVIDILVNNAGVNTRNPLLKTSEEEWDKVMNTNLKGMYLCCQAIGQTMVERQKGSIINIASKVGVRPQPNTGAYSISKAGVMALTRLLAMELAQYKIRVNAVGPGVTKTDMNRVLWGDPEAYKGLVAAIPWGRMAVPEEHAAAVLFLASDAAGYITGQTIFVDGGWLI